MILRGHDAFGDVLRHGSLINGQWIRCYVRITQRQEHEEEEMMREVQGGIGRTQHAACAPRVRFGFAAPKKIAPSAVLRNRIKRLLREAIRRENASLLQALDERKKEATIILMLRRHEPARLKALGLDDIAGDWQVMLPKILSLC